VVESEDAPGDAVIENLVDLPPSHAEVVSPSLKLRNNTFNSSYACPIQDFLPLPWWTCDLAVTNEMTPANMQRRGRTHWISESVEG
jgi:hypothetical protein